MPTSTDPYIRFSCPTCGKRLKAEPQYAGKKTTCMKCKSKCHIPLPDEEPVDEVEEVQEIQELPDTSPEPDSVPSYGLPIDRQNPYPQMAWLWTTIFQQRQSPYPSDVLNEWCKAAIAAMPELAIPQEFQAPAWSLLGSLYYKSIQPEWDGDPNSVTPCEEAKRCYDKVVIIDPRVEHWNKLAQNFAKKEPPKQPVVKKETVVAPELKELVAYFNERKPCEISTVKSTSAHDAIITYHTAVVADPASPKLTYHILKSSGTSSGSSTIFPLIVVATGEQREHDKAWNFSYKPILERSLPGKSWSVFAWEGGYANHSKPGSQLSSTAPFDRLVQAIKDGKYQLECILRPGESAKPTTTSPVKVGLVDNGDGTFNDHSSGLTWQLEDDGQTRTQEDARAYCIQLSLAGFSDWRLPTTAEFESLFTSAKDNAMGIVAYISLNVGDFYWSSSPGPQSNVSCIADGTTAFNPNKYPVRAVRTAKAGAVIPVPPPPSGPVLTGRAAAKRFNDMSNTDDRDVAERNLKAAIEADPTFDIPYCNLGRMLYEQGRYDEARGYLMRAVQLGLPGSNSYEQSSMLLRMAGNR